MAENENVLDMSLFEDQELELNLDLPVMGFTEEPVPTPPGEETEETKETKEETQEEETPPETTKNLSEEITPEVVAKEEGLDTEAGGQENSPNLYSSFATVLNEQGLLPSLDLQETKIETLDDLTVALKSEISNQSTNYLIDKLGQEGFDSLEKGVSVVELQQFNNNIQTLEGIDKTTLTNDIELSKKIILQDYMNQGMDERRAIRILNKSVDAGEDIVIEDAIESLTSLKEFETASMEKLAVTREQEALAYAANQEKIDNDLKNAIYNSDEYVKGQKVTKSMQDKVYKSITEIVSENDGVAENRLMAQRRKDPIAFDTKLYYLFELTNGFSDFSKLTIKSTSTAANKLEKALRSNRFELGGDPTFIDDSGNDYEGVGTEIVFD